VTETQTVDLASWLTAIWDEEERLAEEATPGPWKWQDPGPPHKMALLGENGRRMIVPSRTPDVWPSYMDAHFMEANHPGAVLARIAADRKILAMHTGHHECPSEEDNCGWVTDDRCSTVRLLASPYKGRDGWQENWAHE